YHFGPPILPSRPSCYVAFRRAFFLFSLLLAAPDKTDGDHKPPVATRRIRGCWRVFFFSLSPLAPPSTPRVVDPATPQLRAIPMRVGPVRRPCRFSAACRFITFPTSATPTLHSALMPIG